MPVATDWDHRIIDGTSHALKGVSGESDDVVRLLAAVISEDREKTLAEIAIAFIRWSQDLKARVKTLERELGRD